MLGYTISVVDGEDRLGSISFDSSFKAQGAFEMFWLLTALYSFLDVELVLRIEEANK